MTSHDMTKLTGIWYVLSKVSLSINDLEYVFAVHICASFILHKQTYEWPTCIPLSIINETCIMIAPKLGLCLHNVQSWRCGIWFMPCSGCKFMNTNLIISPGCLNTFPPRMPIFKIAKEILYHGRVQNYTSFILHKQTCNKWPTWTLLSIIHETFIMSPLQTVIMFA